jgi:hypothetical protein
MEETCMSWAMASARAWAEVMRNKDRESGRGELSATTMG